jgi:hypothetical protein
VSDSASPIERPAFSNSPRYDIPDVIVGENDRDLRLVVTDAMPHPVVVVKQDSSPTLRIGSVYIVLDASVTPHKFVYVANGHTICRLIATDDIEYAAMTDNPNLYAVEGVAIPR